eukprot:TRINITY_DN3242_c0_g1_i1.p1 TRINITY_DN3242_c0_g1~~TRINITY_DN3242_c0_g1_i1.p1  ORF type:complete len:181 (-),score=24.77 TRINITY_DN3242_c0_g1_i1:34-576(-)
MGYGYFPAMQGRTVIVTDFFKNGNPQTVSEDVCGYLKKSGIYRVVTGHKPFGDSPTVIKSHGVEFITADTSFSDPSKSDNRGIAVSEVCIQGTESDNQTFIHGQLKEGKKYEFYVSKDNGEPNNSIGDPYIGLQTLDGWWVKVKFLDLGVQKYLLSRGEGHKVFYKELTRKELESHLNVV